jgi:hypothetical protein
VAQDLVAFEGGKATDNPEQRQRREEWQKIQDALQPVIQELVTTVQEQVQLRGPIETRWLEDLRQYHGQYDKNAELELKNEEDRSRTFINITRTKTNAWSARLGDMLLPNDEKNWGIDPTPVPDLTREAQQALAEADKHDQAAEDATNQHNEAVDAGTQDASQPSPFLAAAAQTGAKAQDLRSQHADMQRQIEEARKRCSAMERLIDDQLTESRFPSKCRDVLADMCKLGVGVMKGPIVNANPKAKWVVSGEGTAELKRENSTAPNFRRVDPWHFFPDMSAGCIEEAAFTFERYLPNKKLLRRMAREMGFIPEAVRQLLTEGPGNVNDGALGLAYLSELRSMENSPSGQDTALGPLKERYVVWEYRGALESRHIAAMIRASGRLQDADRFEAQVDELDEHMVTVFFCNGKLLKIEEEYLLDSGASLYSIASFEKAEASILGAVGVPRLMKHEQAMLNSAVRMVMDNAALAVAPQTVIDQNAIEPVNGSWKLTARKVWRWVKGATTEVGERHKPFEFFAVPLNQAQLAEIISIALKFVDEAVAMPLIAQGEQGAHVTETASGMTMLMNSANVVFRRVVKNYDDDMIGLIIRAYDFNMQFSDRPEVKGDMKVEARGTSVLLVREVQAQTLMAILKEWSVHPIMGVGFRAYQAMRMVLQAMSINPDDLLVSEEDYLAKLKAMSDDSGKQSPEDVRAQTQLQVAQIDAASRDKDGQVQLQIAEVRRQTEMARAAQSKDISLAQIEAMFATKKLEVGSKERQLAAEIGVERRNAEEARARGDEPTGSGGSVSMGVEPEGKAA